MLTTAQIKLHGTASQEDDVQLGY